jgi:hypothetical protein
MTGRSSALGVRPFDFPANARHVRGPDHELRGLMRRRRSPMQKLPLPATSRQREPFHRHAFQGSCSHVILSTANVSCSSELLDDSHVVARARSREYDDSAIASARELPATSFIPMQRHRSASSTSSRPSSGSSSAGYPTSSYESASASTIRIQASFGENRRQRIENAQSASSEPLLYHVDPGITPVVGRPDRKISVE